MEQRRHHSGREASSLRRTLIPLLVIAVCLFVFLVIVEHREAKPDKNISAPGQQTQEPAAPEVEEPTPEVEEPTPEVEEPTPPTTEATEPPTTEATEPPTSEATEPETAEPSAEAEEDTKAPKISGVENKMVYLGDAVSYRKGVKVTDNIDPEPKLTIDSSKVDLSEVGTYEVVFTAEDASGNTSSKTMTVTVIKKTKSEVDLDKLNADVDVILKKIIKDDMSTKQQVQAIYKWARSSLGYSSYDGHDWLKAAQHMLDKRTGDCYNYFAVCKLMFERLGIPNIDVVKVKKTSGASNHYWSLVSVDGGKNYYHFDATPRKGDGDDFCLVTDSFIDSYSKTHNYSHNRDKSLYPATPKKALK